MVLPKPDASCDPQDVKDCSVELPCKVGDTVWCVRESWIDGRVVSSGPVTELSITANGVRVIVNRLHIGTFGKTIFRTEREAQKALERLEKQNFQEGDSR